MRCFRCLLLVGALTFSISAASADTRSQTAALEPGMPLERSDGGDSLKQSIARVACTATDAVGTAFVHRSGRILSTDSTVRGCSSVVLVLYDGALVNARVLARDSDIDLALIEADRPLTVSPLKLASASPIELGSMGGFGYPLGYLGKDALPILGNLVGRQTSRTQSGRLLERLVIQAGLNVGSSGSPLLDSVGDVVAMVSGRLAPFSDSSVAALQALQTQHVGPPYSIRRPDGSTFIVSQGQIIAFVLDELRRQIHFSVGSATPVEDVRAFLIRNGVEP